MCTVYVEHTSYWVERLLLYKQFIFCAFPKFALDNHAIYSCVCPTNVYIRIFFLYIRMFFLIHPFVPLVLTKCLLCFDVLFGRQEVH